MVISVLALATLLLVLPGSPPLAAQVRPVYSQGAAGLLQKILELRTTASVLVVGAHPDDEDSAFIARMARGDHARVAYLSLNRGEGGQNAIGPELFEALGVIRTEELLQARTLDGGEQFFTRAFDFGFSKTYSESARLWGVQEVLGDMVRIIRTWRPLVVYSVFTGTEADGHGHHQVAGRLTPLAFKAAADPTQFPEQIAGGLRPWKPLKLYRGTAFGGYGPAADASATTVVETGLLDPLLGRTYAEIAAEGRSQHKTQKMGTPEVRGPRESRLVLLESAVKTPAMETGVFEGLDTSLPGLARSAGLPADSLGRELAAADAALAKAVSAFDALHPQRVVPELADALADIRAARAAAGNLRGASEAARAEAEFLLSMKEREAERALQLAAGMVIDAVSDTETPAAGESFGTSVRIFLAHRSIVNVGTVVLKAPAGWKVVPVPPLMPDPNDQGASYLAESADRVDAFRLTVAEEEKPTQPYWLTAPREGMLFSWPEKGPKGVPFAPPLLNAEVQATIGGAAVTLTRTVQFRQIDPIRGELRRNVEVVPAVSLSFEVPLDIVPISQLGKTRRVILNVQSSAQKPVSGTASLRAPAGWTVVPPAIPFSLSASGERSALE
ncbi:MAG: PIG-L family deacetylase, partial [Spirochaetia bacterium]